MKKDLQIYNFLVNRVPGIREHYHKIRDNSNGPGRIWAWICLIGLNISYYIFRNKKLAFAEKYPYYEEKLLYSNGSESSLSFQISPDEFADELSAYDVISFDVFDTLLFRPFSEPADLFFVLGHMLSYPDFKDIRIAAEKEARKIKKKKCGISEVTIKEIYEVLEEETGLGADPADRFYENEINLEEKFCFANPYMLEVVRLLREKGRRLIVTSDMYLGEKYIKSLILHAGFPEFDAYYISCDRGRSKNSGSLYEFVKDSEIKHAEGVSLSFAHVGDNKISDVKKAGSHGFKPFYYKNVNNTGSDFRPDDMSVITGSVYRGLVNSHIHNGLNLFSREYEYGYIYGGLFVTGYCKFIHDYVKKNGTEKILFLSRDGDVLKQVYELLYPGENNTEYVYWSRLAAAKLTAGRFKHDFFRRFLYHKVNNGETLQKIFDSMELPDLLHGLCKSTRLSPSSHLTDSNIGYVKEYLNANWQRVLDTYEAQSGAACQYYGGVLSGVSSAVAVDIGWAGSGALTLDYLVNDVWNLKCPITGIVAGTNSCSNYEPDFSETFLQSGKLVSYLYSQRENRDIWKFHDPAKNHNSYLEVILDAPCGSFVGFYPGEDGQYELKFRQNHNDESKVLEIQRGILDFAGQWKAVSAKLGKLDYISGRDAYAPFIIMESAKNKKFMQGISYLLDDIGI